MGPRSRCAALAYALSPVPSQRAFCVALKQEVPGEGAGFRAGVQGSRTHFCRAWAGGKVHGPHSLSFSTWYPQVPAGWLPGEEEGSLASGLGGMELACREVLYTPTIYPAQGRSLEQALPPGGPQNQRTSSEAQA